MEHLKPFQIAHMRKEPFVKSGMTHGLPVQPARYIMTLLIPGLQVARLYEQELWLSEYGRAAPPRAGATAGRGVRDRRRAALALHRAPQPGPRPAGARQPGRHSAAGRRRGDYARYAA